MKYRNVRYLRVVAMLLSFGGLVGCASLDTIPASSNNLNAMHISMQSPIRIILYFQHPTSENKQLSSAIADACSCQPVFIRSYSGDALIYEIELPQGQTFATFEKSLMRHSGELGIKLIEQDCIMQHQQRSGDNAQAPIKALMPGAK